VSTFRFAGAIFDLDGTLVMSEHLHRQSWIQPLEELGITVDEDAYWRDFAGKPGMQIIRDHVGLEGDAAVSLYERVTNSYWQLAVEHAAPTAGVVDFLDQIAATPKSVCTSAQRDSAMRMLDMLDLTRRFDAIVTATEVTHGKPDPEPFLLAASRIGIDPAHCVAFEDSTNGLIAARAAGMTCIGIGAGSGASAQLADGWIVDFTDPALSQLVMA
jgi:sugar-phosphatase